jgi:glycosyltransferase involved in cell wall biosynthesis
MNSICLVVQNVYDFDPRVRRKAEALAVAGYSVDVLALRAPGGKKAYVLNGVHVQTFSLGKKRASRVRYAFEYLAFFVWVFLLLPWRMPRRSYAVIDVNTLPDFLIFAPVLAKWMGAKLILDLHEITPEFYMSRYGIGEKLLAVRLLKYIEKVSIRFADRVITINQPIEDLLVGRGCPRWKSTIVMNSADEAKFLSRPASVVEEPSRSEFVMLYHGTLTRIYGLDLAIEAFALVHAQMQGARLCILGSGTEREELARLAQARGLTSKVQLVGQVPATEIPSWLSRCDAGILPIRRDVFLDFAFPNKLPEFILMRKPVIVSRLKAIGHYFSEEALAYFEPNDPASLAQQMLRIYQDRQLRIRLAHRAEAEYIPISWSVMRQRYLGTVKELLAVNAGHAEQSRKAAQEVNS